MGVASSFVLKLMIISIVHKSTIRFVLIFFLGLSALKVIILNGCHWGRVFFFDVKKNIVPLVFS